MSKITYNGHLVISVNKGRASASACHLWRLSGRLTAKKPTLGRDEVAMAISVELPASLFETPQLEARIKVPEGSAAPLVIGLDVKDNLEEIIRRNTGFDVRILPED